MNYGISLAAKCIRILEDKAENEGLSNSEFHAYQIWRDRKRKWKNEKKKGLKPTYSPIEHGESW